MDYLQQISDCGFSEDIISIDIETDGLNYKKDDILSIGSVDVNDRLINVNSEYYKIFDSKSQDTELIKIHELIVDQGTNNFDDVIPELIYKIGNRTILGHFIALDVSFINYALKKRGLPKLKNPVKDTLDIALKKDKVFDLSRVSRSDYTLYALCERFNIEIATTHNALEDAFLTAQLYLHLEE